MAGEEPEQEGRHALQSSSSLTSTSSPRPPAAPLPAPKPNPSFTLLRQWQTYFQRILDLCRTNGISPTNPPGPDLPHPPPGLDVQRPQDKTFNLTIAPRDITGGSRPDSETVPRRALAMQPVPGTGAVSRAGSGNGPHSADAATTPHPPLLPCETGYGSDDPASGSRVLILLDMNGTLLYRHKRPQPILLGKNTHAEPAFVHGHPDPFHYFMRPGSREFVEAIARHPRARVAFYTSMRLENALPAARSLMSEDCRNGKDPEIYDRRFNAHDPDGANPWDTTRDLPKIWSTHGRVGAGFGPKNTVVVDDTPRKMRHMSAGLVVVPEYKEACIIAAFGVRGGQDLSDGREFDVEVVEKARRHQLEVMPRLTEYMCRLLAESVDDVRPFIAQNRFEPHSSP